MTATVEAHRLLRVSAREVQEMTWRAFRAFGVSDGEASHAARGVRHAEIHLGAGLQAVPDHLTPAAGTRTSCILVTGTVDRVDDPADRGLLFTAPLAIDLVAARPQGPPVLLPSAKFDLVLAGLLAQRGRSEASDLMAFELDGSGNPGRGLSVNRDGAISLITAEVTLPWLRAEQGLLSELMAGEQRGGLMFTSDLTTLGVPVDAPVTHPARSVQAARAAADGVLVDASVWESVYAAAQGFLVAER